MRICILTIGSRGDIQPCLALGVRLQTAGHQVRIATHEIFRDMANNYGLDFFLIEGDPIAMMEEFTNSGGNALHFIHEQKRLIQAIQSIFVKIFEDAWKAAQDTEILISANIMLYAGYSIAEKLKIPSLGFSLQPTIRTRSIPSPFLPFNFSLGKTYNLLTHDLVDQIYWQEARIGVNKLRKNLGMPLLPFLGIYRQLIKQHYPFLCAYSPLVVPKAHDWSTKTHVTGYWFLNPLTSWEPPQDLIDFLSAGPPPIFIGFGSTTIRNSEDITALVFEALKQTGQRGIIAQGWGGLSSANLPKSVFAVKDIPFDWLFPRMAALVHHGGAGTTAYGLRAGVPTIIIPFILDHFFWGRQITALGIGPQPILPKRLTTERLANAIHIAINDQALRTRASKIGEALQAEQGVEQAVRIIESIKASSLS